MTGGARTGRRDPLVVAGVALGVRLLHLAVAGDAGLFHGLFLDSAYYAEQAAAIRGFGEADAPYLLSPLYPYLLAPFVGADGALAVGGVRVLQALLGAGTAALAAAIGARVGGRAVAWVAGLGVALLGPLVHYESLLLVAGPQAFAVTLGVWLWLRAERPRDHALAGLALGVAAALRPTVLFVLVAIAVAAAVRVLARREPRRPVALRAGALAAGALVAVLPFTARNLAASGEPVLLSANGGFNFWIGNHAGARGGFNAPPGLDHLRDPVGVALASRETGRELDHGEAAAWWSERAWDDVAADPARWVGLLGRKVLLFAHPVEIPQLGESFAWYRERAWTLRFPVDGRLLLLLAFAAPAAALLRRGRDGVRQQAPLLLVLGAYTAAVALFFATGRYRAPVLPIAAVLAAACAVDLVALARDPRRRREPAFLATVGGVLALASGSQWLYVGEDAPLHVPAVGGSEERQLGITLFERGEPAAAADSFRASLAVRDDPVTRVNLANALAATGRLPEAEAEYRRALEADPNYADGWHNLGDLYRVRLQRFADAEAAYARAVESNPLLAESHLGLGIASLALERPADALPAFERAVELADVRTPWRAQAEAQAATLRAALGEGGDR